MLKTNNQRHFLWLNRPARSPDVPNTSHPTSQDSELTVDAKRSLEIGASFPYDASDKWWNDPSTRNPPKAVDWAHGAARGILHDLTDRAGIKAMFDGLDEATRVHMIASIAEIIRVAHAGKNK
jgi:hypothetical protein